MADQVAQAADPSADTSSGGNVLDWLVKEYLSTKIQRAHIINQNGANLVYNHGRNMAQKLGLTDNGITPFPAPTNITVQHPQPPPLPANPVWKQVAFGAAMLGAGAALGPVGSLAVGAIGNMLGVNQPTGAQPPETAVDGTIGTPDPGTPGSAEVGIRIE
jgi:hypothetical protein